MMAEITRDPEKTLYHKKSDGIKCMNVWQLWASVDRINVQSPFQMTNYRCRPEPCIYVSIPSHTQSFNFITPQHIYLENQKTGFKKNQKFL